MENQQKPDSVVENNLPFTPKQEENSEPQIPSVGSVKPKAKSKKTILIMVVVIILVLLISVFAFFYLKGKSSDTPGENNAVDGVTPTLSGESGEDGVSVVFENIDWKPPTKYVYRKEGGELLIGVLGKNEEYTIAPGKGQFGFLNEVSVSPDGNFLVYLRLPDETIEEYNQSPPYEFHGSNEWELHFVDIRNLRNIKDEVILAGILYGLDDKNTYFWEEEVNKLYILKDYDYGNNIADIRVYDIKSKTLSKNDGNYPKLEVLTVSPEGKYLKIEEQSDKENSISSYYNLDLYSADGTFVKTLYENFISTFSENDAAFPNEKTVFLTREDFVNEGNSICYIEKIDVESGAVAELQKKNCPPDQSYTSYLNPSLSPDGRYLLTTYAEKENGSLFLYDMINKVGKEVAMFDTWISDFWWVSRNQVIVFLPEGRFNFPEDRTYVVNIETGEVQEEGRFEGKQIEEVF